MKCCKKICSREGFKAFCSFLFVDGKIKEQLSEGNVVYYVRYSLFKIFLFSLFNFGYAFLIGFISAVMFPEDVIFFVGDKNKPKTLGILLGIAAGVTLFLGPLSGNITDKTRLYKCFKCEIGKRRPYIYISHTLYILSLACRVFVRFKGTGFLIAYAVLGIFGMGCTCVAVTAYTALFPDLFHPSQYDIVSASLGFSQLLGGAIAVGVYGYLWAVVDYRINVLSASFVGFLTMFPLVVFSEERGLKIKKEKEDLVKKNKERKKSEEEGEDEEALRVGEDEEVGEVVVVEEEEQNQEEEERQNLVGVEDITEYHEDVEEEEGGGEINQEEVVNIEDVSPNLQQPETTTTTTDTMVMTGVPGLGAGDSSDEEEDLMMTSLKDPSGPPKSMKETVILHGKKIQCLYKYGCCCCRYISKFSWRYVAPFLHWNFFWVFVARFVFMFSIAAFQSYLLYFLRDCLDVYDLFGNKKMVTNESQAQSFVGCIVFFFGLVSSIGGPALSKRLRRKCVVSISGLIMVIGSTGIIVFRSYFTVILFFSIPMGVGLGSFYAVDMALVNQVLPNPEETAKDLAIFAVATTIPFAVAAPVMGLLINIGNDHIGEAVGVDQFGYYLMFGFGIFVQIIGSIFVLFVRKKSKKQRLKEILNDLNMFDENEIEGVLEEKKKRRRDNVMYDDDDDEGSRNTIDHRGILMGRFGDEEHVSLDSPSNQIAEHEYSENSPIVIRTDRNGGKDDDGVRSLLMDEENQYLEEGDRQIIDGGNLEATEPSEKEKGDDDNENENI